MTINEIIYEVFNAREDPYINQMIKHIQLKQAQRRNFMKQNAEKYSSEIRQKVLNQFAKKDTDALRHAINVSKVIYNNTH